MDYGSILDFKTKRRFLMDRFENQKNTIQYFIEEHDSEKGIAERVVPDLEELVTMMDEFLKTHFENEPIKDAMEYDEVVEHIVLNPDGSTEVCSGEAFDNLEKDAL